MGSSPQCGKLRQSMFRPINREEFFNALNRVGLITLALMLASYVLLIGVMILTDFKDALLHYTIATVFTLILAPVAAFPLFVMSDRLRVAKNDLEGLLRVDALTDLPNRRAFFERTEEIFARRGSLAVMMIDVDHFKSVNDSYGHDLGDRVLRSVAQSIQRITEQASTDGVKFAARIGGEEFAVLIEGITSEAADVLANHIVEQIGHSPVHGDGRLISVTVSVGVAHRRGNDTPGAVLREADAACYRAKRLGRNQWHRSGGPKDPSRKKSALTAA
jgi:diguanylate cyclase (GGDEF)-like protein